MISKNRLQKIARNTIRISLGIKEKEVVIIDAGPKSLQFAEALAFEAAIIGAHPVIQYGSSELGFKIFKVINKRYLKHVPKLSKIMVKMVDAQIHIDDSNPFIDKKLPQDKIEIRRKVVKPLKKIRDRRVLKKDVKIALVGFPNRELAKSLKISFNKLDNIFWNTLDIDFNKLHKYNSMIARKTVKANRIRITGERTDLEFSIKGRPPLVDSGIWAKEKYGYLNLPAGEVFYTPVENSAEGEIYFDLPCMWHYGKQVEGVWFKFHKGKVVDYSIKKGLSSFEDIMKNASGSKFNIAELGIGTNPNAKPTGGMTIVDEKIRGTIHIAIGDNKSFGGKSDATIHWDFFKTMKKGDLEVDGKIMLHNGKLVR